MPQRNTAKFPNKNMPYVMAVENTLRKKIGSQIALNRIFTSDKMQQCQTMFDKVHAEFLEEAKQQLALIGQEYTRAAGDPQQVESALGRIGELSMVIRKRMEALNFLFGFEVAKSLGDYTRDASAASPDMMLIVCKHIAVLNIIMKEGLTGDGGMLGKELLANLHALIKKTQK